MVVRQRNMAVMACSIALVGVVETPRQPTSARQMATSGWAWVGGEEVEPAVFG